MELMREREREIGRKNEEIKTEGFKIIRNLNLLPGQEIKKESKKKRKKEREKERKKETLNADLISTFLHSTKFDFHFTQIKEWLFVHQSKLLLGLVCKTLSYQIC